MRIRGLSLVAAGLMAVQATGQETMVKSDSELRTAIQSHTWYSARHRYRFLPSGIISVDGYPSQGETWTIQNGLLYRKVKGSADSPPTKIIAINERQLVEQEISGPYNGSVEVMYSRR
jgi:hypothetical protein